MIEKTETNYSAYTPDVSGCVATGDTIEETIEQMRKALQMHFEAIIRDHEPLPHPY